MDAGITDPGRPHHRNAAVATPIPIETVQAAAAELDVVVAIAEVFRSDPEWTAPERVWAQLADTLPTLLG